MIKVLIVEDDASIVKVTRIVLERAGYEVMAAEDEKCFEIAQKWDPSIILMDVRLPRLDGIEACMKLKMNPVTAHIPVILVTADRDAEELINEACADGLLIKPFGNEALIQVVKTHTDEGLASGFLETREPEIRDKERPD